MRNDKIDENNSIFADERKDAMERLMTKRVNLMNKLMETDMEVMRLCADLSKVRVKDEKSENKKTGFLNVTLWRKEDRRHELWDDNDRLKPKFEWIRINSELYDPEGKKVVQIGDTVQIMTEGKTCQRMVIGKVRKVWGEGENMWVAIWPGIGTDIVRMRKSVRKLN